MKQKAQKGPADSIFQGESISLLSETNRIKVAIVIKYSKVTVHDIAGINCGDNCGTAEPSDVIPRDGNPIDLGRDSRLVLFFHHFSKSKIIESSPLEKDRMYLLANNTECYEIAQDINQLS